MEKRSADRAGNDDVGKEGQYNGCQSLCESANNTEDDSECESFGAAERKPKSKVLFTFRNVEESLQPFSGEKTQNVKKWIENFELMSEMLNWTDSHSLAYAKRLLRGPAKMFVNTEKKISSWEKLKVCLMNEYG